ncbi:MalY/PatB family protein [Sporolactobacillus nakayamae]|nr:PatB family C-S lyase [Sporolactobacillus nakayamae]
MSDCIFDRIVARENTNCVKWDGAERLYGKPHLLPMWIADMDFSAPDCVINALKECLEQKIFGYTLCPESLKQVVQTWLNDHYAWKVPSEAIVFNHNVVSSIALALRVLTKNGDKVLIHNPVYNPFFEQINQLGRIPVVSELELHDHRYYMNVGDMERKINEENVSCILICSPHNPGGRIWNAEELQEVVALAANYNLPIIADEIHSDLVLPGKKHQPIALLAGNQCANIVTLMAPTKTFNLAGIGPSYILTFNPEIAAAIKHEQKVMVYPEINPFQIAAMTAAYGKGEQWMKDLIVYVKGNSDYVRAKLSEIDGLHCMDSDATYLMWISYADLGFSEEEVNKALVECGVALQMGSTYGKAGCGFVRMNVAAPRTLVEQGTEKVVRAFKGLLAMHTHR